MAPTPCAARAPKSRSRLPAAPATRDAAANTDPPATTSVKGRTRRWSSATGTDVIATASAYVVSTHETPTIDVSNSP